MPLLGLVVLDSPQQRSLHSFVNVARNSFFLFDFSMVEVLSGCLKALRF